MHTSLRSHRAAAMLMIPTMLAGLVLAFAMLAYGHSLARAQADPDLNVGAGVGSGTVNGAVFTPGEFTVEVGSSVTWTVESDEPHTITFGAGPEGVAPPEWPVSGFDEPPPGPPGPVDLGSTEYDGTGFVNTGVIFGGSTATIEFTSEGEYPFSCVIHPGMTGTVTVVAEGEDATSQEEADAAAKETEDLILGQVDDLESATLDSVTSETRSDGTKLWKIWTNAVNEPAPMPGGGTGYLELLDFIPEDLKIKQGDTVEWTSTTIHTVTFAAEGTDPSTLDPFGTAPAKPSDTYDGKSLYNSGLIGPEGGPQAPTTFDLTFNDVGTFNYLCLLHGFLGQTGTVTVSEAPGQLPGTGGPPGDGSGGLPWTLIAGSLAIVLAGATFVGARIKRRQT